MNILAHGQPTMTRGVLALIALLLSTCVWALEPAPMQVERIIAALKNLDKNNLDEAWHFTMTVVQKDEQQVIRSHPGLAPRERRQLVAVNGSAPDKKRLAEFRKTENKRIDDEDPDGKGFETLVNIDSLELVQATDDQMRFAFSPYIKALEKEQKNLRGELLLNVETGQIEEIEIINTEKLSPAFSVSLESYTLKLQFRDANGHHLLHSMESKASGKAGFLKSFDEHVTIQFSDFVALATSENAAQPTEYAVD